MKMQNAFQMLVKHIDKFGREFPYALELVEIDFALNDSEVEQVIALYRHCHPTPVYLRTETRVNADDGWCVVLHADPNRGHFERNGEDIGGLWFDAGRTLTDFDGTFELPKPVLKTLRANGYIVDSSFE